ncbi:MAG: hypothetical protein HYW24_01940 [Candidatus Aenigmarchaeota archaeon]|nr:hypothetical protein [Candidatus Aenigmarchaeota archaeon]
MKRREFLAALGITTLAVAGGYLYLNDQKMEKPPKKEGMILADLHAHPGRNKSREGILEMLNWGVTGLTETNVYNGLTYNDVVNEYGAKEIERGIFAEVNYNGGKGYVVKSQECSERNVGPHILAVGCMKLIDDDQDPRKIVEDIHKQGGIATINHPLVTPTGNWPVKYRMIKPEERKVVEELCRMVDEIEVFNAQNIGLIPYFSVGGIRLDMRLANELAKELATEYGFKGTAASDAHSRLEQVKCSGIYVPETNISFEALKDHIKNKRFERHEQYVSRGSFLMGHFVG